MNNNDYTNRPFTHRAFDLWPPMTGRSGGRGSGGKARMDGPKKEATAILDRVCKLGCISETVMCPRQGNFFEELPRLAGGPKGAWSAIMETPYLRWILPALDPASVRSMLPDDWGRDGWPNVCIALRVTNSDPSVSAKINGLRNLPARHRALLVGPLTGPLDLCGRLEGIQWVVADAGPDVGASAPWIRAIRDTCLENEVPFMLHCAGTPCELDGRLWLDHPFGERVDMARAPLEDDRLVALAGSQPNVMPAKAASSKAAKEVTAEIRKGPDEPTKVPEEPKADTPQSEVPAPGQTPQPTASEVREVECEVVTSPGGSRGELSAGDQADFDRLNGIVERYARYFYDAGNALLEIRDRELWRAGGHASWNAYCENVKGISRQHCNRLIKGAGIVDNLHGVEPVGSTPLIQPDAETQVRPLCRLESNVQQAEAWQRAVKVAGGGQPTAKVVKQVVAEILARQGGDEPEEPIIVQTTVVSSPEEIMERLRQVAAERRSWDEVTSLVEELESALASDKACKPRKSASVFAGAQGGGRAHDKAAA